jgi:hypothetical protein
MERRRSAMTESELRRGPGRPRKEPEPAAPAEPAAPGPIRLEIRVNDKIACAQRVHSYSIDQQPDTLTVTGVLRQ